MKNRKKKERNKSWDQVFKQKEVATVLGLNPVHWYNRHSSNFYYH